MDKFYKYYIRYFDDIAGDEKEDSGIVYSPKGNIVDATNRICFDYGGKNSSNIIEIKVINIYEDGEYTISTKTLDDFSVEVQDG